MKYKQRGTLFHAAKREVQKRDSSYCKFIAIEGTVHQGSILRFCLCNDDPIAIIEAYGIVHRRIEK